MAHKCHCISQPRPLPSHRVQRRRKADGARRVGGAHCQPTRIPVGDPVSGAEKDSAAPASITHSSASRRQSATGFPAALSPYASDPVPEGPGLARTPGRPGQPRGRRGRPRDPSRYPKIPVGFFRDAWIHGYFRILLFWKYADMDTWVGLVCRYRILG